MLYKILNKKILLLVFPIVFFSLFAGDVNAYCASDGECPSDKWTCKSWRERGYKNYYCEISTGMCRYNWESVGNCDESPDLACSDDYCSGDDCGHCTYFGNKRSDCNGYDCCGGCYYNMAQPDSSSDYCVLCDHHHVQITNAGTGYLECEYSCGASQDCDEREQYETWAVSGTYYYCDKECQKQTGSPPSCPGDCPDETWVDMGPWCRSDTCERYRRQESVDYSCASGVCDRVSSSTRTIYENAPRCTIVKPWWDADFVTVDSSNYCSRTVTCLDINTCYYIYHGCDDGGGNCDGTWNCADETYSCPEGTCCWEGDGCGRCPCADECEDYTDPQYTEGCCSGLDPDPDGPQCVDCAGKEQANLCGDAGTCEQVCGADSRCDELDPNTDIPFCDTTGTLDWFGDNCMGSPDCSGGDRDNICRSPGSLGGTDGCSASTDCDDHIIYRCSSTGPVDGYCGDQCKLETAEESEEACHCDACDILDNSPESSCPIDDAGEDPWNEPGQVIPITPWNGDINENCCGNDANEYTKNPVCIWNCSDQLVGVSSVQTEACPFGTCYRIKGVKACCDSLTDCVWKDGEAEACYSDEEIITDNLGNNITCVDGIWYDSPAFSDGEVESVFYFSGDLEYLNSFWNLDYPYVERIARVECGLNCDPLVSCPDESECIPYPYEQNPGRGTCAVPNPNYEFTGSNNISCLVYDIDLPEVYSFYNYVFKPVDFTVSVSPTITTTVGEVFALPINIKNIGLLTDDYTVAVITTVPNIIYIEHNYSIIRGIETDEIGDTYARIKLLSAVPTSIKINVTSLVSCQYSECISKEIVVNIRGGAYSLPDFGIIGIVQIMIIATLVLAFVNLKKIKTYL